MLDSCKIVEKQSEGFLTFLWHFFPSLKQNFIAYPSCKVSSRPDFIFENHQLWQSGFSLVYFDCYCSCWFEPEILKIGQSSHKMYCNKILNFQESMTILNVCTKTSGNLLRAPRTFVYLNFLLFYSFDCSSHVRRRMVLHWNLSVCLPAFFWCLSNSGTFTELQITSFLETTGVTCSDSVCHNRVQVFSITVFLLTCNRDMIVFLWNQRL